jgi:hypothetical protein
MQTFFFSFFKELTKNRDELGNKMLIESVRLLTGQRNLEMDAGKHYLTGFVEGSVSEPVRLAIIKLNGNSAYSLYTRRTLINIKKYKYNTYIEIFDVMFVLALCVFLYYMANVLLLVYKINV